MDEQPFPQYRKGVPKAGLDEITHWGLALLIAGLAFFLIQMLLSGWSFAPLFAGVIAYLTFKFVSVPFARFVFSQLPPMYIQHAWGSIFFRGGLIARPDPDPLPFQIKVPKTPTKGKVK